MKWILKEKLEAQGQMNGERNKRFIKHFNIILFNALHNSMRKIYYSCFTDKETEVLRAKYLSLDNITNEWNDKKLNPGLSHPKSMHSFSRERSWI